jgi:hypothetical protein
MRVIAFIDNPEVVEKILRQVDLWCGPAAFAPARPPPSMVPESIGPDFRIEYDTVPTNVPNNHPKTDSCPF